MLLAYLDDQYRSDTSDKHFLCAGEKSTGEESAGEESALEESALEESAGEGSVVTTFYTENKTS